MVVCWLCLWFYYMNKQAHTHAFCLGVLRVTVECGEVTSTQLRASLTSHPAEHTGRDLLLPRHAEINEIGSWEGYEGCWVSQHAFTKWTDFGPVFYKEKMDDRTDRKMQERREEGLFLAAIFLASILVLGLLPIIFVIFSYRIISISTSTCVLVYCCYSVSLLQFLHQVISWNIFSETLMWADVLVALCAY